MYSLVRSMDQSRSQVHEINQVYSECESSGIQQLDALETLLIYLIGKFGPLTSPKLFELVSCFGSHGFVGAASRIEKVISNTLQNLMFEKHQILYVPEFGKWKLNHADLNGSEAELVCSLEIPRFALRDVSDFEQSLNVKGVGDEYVYVVYHSESRIESVLRNRDNWLLKVGRTNNLQRRVAQLSESGPNSLVIGVAYKTYNSRGLEKYIHQALHAQKKECIIPGRREWFYSNVVEISSLRGQFENKLSHES
jgi:hypothetical protein